MLRCTICGARRPFDHCSKMVEWAPFGDGKPQSALIALPTPQVLSG